jgi:hypothetical protein
MLKSIQFKYKGHKMYIVTYIILITLLVLLLLSGLFSLDAIGIMNTPDGDDNKTKEVCLEGTIFYRDSNSIQPIIDINNTLVKCKE